MDSEKIHVTGNPVIDALNFVSKQTEPQEITNLLNNLGINDQPTTKPKTKKLILVTAHRRENFGEPLENIFYALKELAQRDDVEIVYPVHLNPNVQEPANRILKDQRHITLLPPLDYLPLVHLMKHATLILTDSGGIQEEAPAFGIPVLVLRETTERRRESLPGRSSSLEQKQAELRKRRSVYWMIQLNTEKCRKRPIHMATGMRLNESLRHYSTRTPISL